jgi:hypothetical protein
MLIKITSVATIIAKPAAIFLLFFPGAAILLPPLQFFVCLLIIVPDYHILRFVFKMTPQRREGSDAGVHDTYIEELTTKPTKVPLEYKRVT